MLVSHLYQELGLFPLKMNLKATGSIGAWRTTIRDASDKRSQIKPEGRKTWVNGAGKGFIFIKC